MKKILVIGSLNMDLVSKVEYMPKPGETVIGSEFLQVPGGKGANQAATIGKLGGDVSMMGKVGDDDFGRHLMESLKESGVDTSSLGIQSDSPTGTALIMVDSEGENSIVVIPGANFKVDGKYIDENIEEIKKADIVVSQLETPIETVERSFKAAKELGKYTILNPAPAKELTKGLIESIDLLIPNETELELLSGMKIGSKEELIRAAKLMIGKGVKQLIITLGSKGAMYIDSQEAFEVPSFKVDAVDTTGAGDSFTGALSYSIANGHNIKESMRFASKVGALTVTKFGAQSSFPTIDEVLNFDFEEGK